MLTKWLLFLLLPAIAYSRITIKIIAGKTADDVAVRFSGYDEAVISDKERKTFRLDDENLKRASYKYQGKRCDDVFVKPPTPWGDVYSKYNWDIVKRTLKPVVARLLGVKSNPVNITSEDYINKYNLDLNYSTSVAQQVEETVEHTWSSGGELSVEQKVHYNINFGTGSGGGATSLSYTSSWGEDTTESRTVTLGTTSSKLIPIPPGQRVVAVLTASQGILEIEVDYEATLNNGDVFCNYDKSYKGHHFNAFPLRKLQKLQNLPKTVRTTEKISVGFYSSARIEVNNGTTQKEIEVVPAAIIKVGPQKKV